MRKLWMVWLTALVLAGCASSQPVKNKIDQTLDQAVEDAAAKEKKQQEVDAALLPPVQVGAKPGETQPLEAKFDLSVNKTSAKEVFAAIGSGTRYNMLPMPGVEGELTLNLRDVTIFEALDTIRALYGYDYRVEGKNIYIQPIALQTRLFKIDYLAANRDSSSSLTVRSSGQQGTGYGGTGMVTPGTLGTSASMQFNPYLTGGSGSGSPGGGVSSTITTQQNKADFNFWKDLEDSLKRIVTPAGKTAADSGREVVINRMTGVIVVRAMPDELRQVKEYLDASQISIERQVIIEAKFVEVTLADGYQSGVNWGVFASGGNNARLSAGVVPNGVSSGGNLLPNAAAGTSQAMTTNGLTADPGSSIGGLASAVAGSVFGLAFQTNNFGAMLNFLETQGNVHVLSSPRIATLNNQKAVLKVGVDEPYAINFAQGTATTTTTGTSTALPTPLYSQLFSGIALDVTPRVTDKDEVILHIHPSISQVSAKKKDAGSGQYMDMATTNIEETDSVVRAKAGQIVVIGGLMSQTADQTESGIPGLWKTLFGQSSRATQKRELVILLKPTVVTDDRVWADDLQRSRDRMRELSR